MHRNAPRSGIQPASADRHTVHHHSIEARENNKKTASNRQPDFQQRRSVNNRVDKMPFSPADTRLHLFSNALPSIPCPGMLDDQAYDQARWTDTSPRQAFLSQGISMLFNLCQMRTIQNTHRKMGSPFDKYDLSWFFPQKKQDVQMEIPELLDVFCKAEGRSDT